MSVSFSDLIPASRIADVEAALKSTFNSQPLTDIALLAGGLSGSAVYKIIVQDRAYVLKLEQPAATGSPDTALALAAKAGIAPTLYFQDISTGISISSFIDNRSLRTVFAPEKLTSELAIIISKIHAIPCNKEGADLETTIDNLISDFRQSRILYGPVFDECFVQYEKIKSWYPWRDGEKVFSHNDLNPNNILCDGEKLWIVDWDTAYLNDRYVDLSGIANFFVHTPELEKEFLQAYFGRAASEQETARFYIMRQASRIIYAMLMFRLAAQAQPAGYSHSQEMEGMDMKTFGALMGAGKLSLATYEGQLMYGKALLNEAVYQMRTVRFAEAIGRGNRESADGNRQT
ncbi:MAG: phosphotransferase [Chitinophagaceae bacterium]